MNEWIDTDEMLPELDINVFVVLNGKITVGSRFDDGEGWLWAIAQSIDDDLNTAETLCDDEYFPSYWMPIMAVPNAK